MKVVSIVIPAYNEERFIGDLLKRIQDVPTASVGFDKEILVVDDGSRDRTAEIAAGFPGVTVMRQVPNKGKGAAVQLGVRRATGDFILVQDADLEYDPADYLPMLAQLAQQGPLAVYGSRTLGSIRDGGWRRLCPGRTPGQSLGPWLAGIVLSLWTAILFGRWISDTLTAYKVYPTGILRQLTINTHGFETDHEITGKLIRAGVRIREVPISYRPRSLAEGKKIRAADGLIALATLLKCRLGCC